MQRISIHDVPARQRAAYLHDFVAARVAGLSIRPDAPDSFDYEVSARTVGEGVLVSTARYGAVTGARSRGQLADGRSNYVLSVHDTDYELEVDGQVSSIRAGELVIVDEARPYRFALPGTGVLVVSLDRARLAGAAPWIAGRGVHRFSAGCPRAGLLAGYARLLQDQPADADATDVADHVYRLAARLGPARGEAAADKGLGAARLRMVKADIDARLADPDLDIAAVARRQRVTPRYVQQLFARTGTSFSAHLRERRLDWAIAVLRDPREYARGIADVAFGAGFADLSTFNRAFRRRFDATPSDIRAQTLSRMRD